MGVEIVCQIVCLGNALTTGCFVREHYTTLETVGLTLSLELDKDESSDCVDCILVNLELRRKN